MEYVLLCIRRFKTVVMRKRFCKAISVPLALGLFVPIVVGTAVAYVFAGSPTPFKVLEKYFGWLDN
jgi:hypothetical protein